MNECFYHGIEPYYGIIGEQLNVVYNILNEGLKTRNEISNLGDEYEHICLFRKNDDYDYSSDSMITKSAYYGWIENSFVFIISGEILAHKVVFGNVTGFDSNNQPISNLVDEWRSVGGIQPQYIIGLALPFSFLNEYFEETDITDEDLKNDIEKAKLYYQKICEFCSENNLLLCSSENKNILDNHSSYHR